jgi:2-dehydropantoate 2-reductase
MAGTSARLRVGVAGAGGVGGLAAALLARAGHRVALLARGEALDAIRARGLEVATPPGDFSARVELASDSPAALGPCDVLLVAVKTWQVAALAPQLAPMVGPGTVVVPLQNGVEAAERLARGLPGAQVAGGVCFVFSRSEGPGKVRHAGAPLSITIGERAGAPLPGALAPLVAALTVDGLRLALSAGIDAGTWEKLLFASPYGAVGALARAPAGPIRSTPETRALLAGLMAEAAAVARARGVPLGGDVVERTMAKLDAVPADATVSMQRDLAAGRPSELQDQIGAVIRIGAATATPTPLHDAVSALLLPLERAARGEAPQFTHC